ncbi:MAG: hypothetical protein PHV06_04155, partial [bacterium]|nr:hypothetical protein [bacterium]
LLSGEIECENVLSESDSGTGYWFKTGIIYNLTDIFGFGLAFGKSYGEVTILDTDGDAGGSIFSFFVYYRLNSKRDCFANYVILFANDCMSLRYRDKVEI